jgi:hypothetical protein
VVSDKLGDKAQGYHKRVRGDVWKRDSRFWDEMDGGQYLRRLPDF